MSRSSSRSSPVPRREIDPSTMGIPAALARLAACLDTTPGAPRRVVLRHTFNPAVPAELQSHEDRTAHIRTAYIERIISQGDVLTAGQVEWCALRAQQMQNSVVAGPDAEPGDVEFVTDMLTNGKLYLAVQAQKASSQEPLAILQPRRRVRTGTAVSGSAPDVVPQMPAAVVQ